jgi:hypothetical protein
VEYHIYRKIDWDLSAVSAAPGEYPPGDWDYIKTVPASYEDDYSTVVPTLADSTIAKGM